MPIVKEYEGYRSDEPDVPGRKNGHAASHAFRSRGNGAHRDERPKDTTLYDAQTPPPSVAVARERYEKLDRDIENISRDLEGGKAGKGAEYARQKKEEELSFVEEWLVVHEALEVLQKLQRRFRGMKVSLSEDDKEIIEDLAAYVNEKPH